MTITYKDAAGVAAMRTACRLASEVLDHITPHIQPGITTNDIDRIAAAHMRTQGTTSATLGYQPGGYPPYPKSLCTSVNHVVCHGIPNDKPLKKGDIVNVDVTVIKDGWFGDTSRMFMVGEVSIAAKRLVNITFEAMWRGIVQVRPGVRLGDIGNAIQRFAEGQGFSIVREFCGHGIGQKFHEEPQVLHYGKPGTLDELKPGMTFTIEPMINAGRRDVKELGNDGWTIVTKDHSLSAQWEHTVLVTEVGYEVLTLSAGSPPVPAFVAAMGKPADADLAAGTTTPTAPAPVAATV
jgi:methionyl aminopeptidase